LCAITEADQPIGDQAGHSGIDRDRVDGRVSTPTTTLDPLVMLQVPEGIPDLAFTDADLAGDPLLAGEAARAVVVGLACEGGQHLLVGAV